MSDDVEDQDKSPLMDAVHHAVYVDGPLQNVRRLIADGADINTKHWIHGVKHLPFHHPDQIRHRWTPLMVACYWGHEELVQLLIEAGAGLEDRDEQGSTALIWAVWAGHPGIVR